MHIYLKNYHAKFHPDSIRNDRAVDFLKSIPSKNKKYKKYFSSYKYKKYFRLWPI